MKKLLLLIGIPVLLLFGGYLFVAFFLPLSLPHVPESTIYLDKNGKEIGEVLASSGSIRHRELVFHEIPPFFLEALVTLEDRTFWTNDGVSLRGILRSARNNLEAGKIVEGATTLSSGLIRNALWLNNDRDFSTKILEFLYAIRLNHLLTKEEIITEYINRIAFGHMTIGLASASLFYFDRAPENLTHAEQIALLVLPKNPERYDPYEAPLAFRERFTAIVAILEDTSVISHEEADSILSEKISWNQIHRPAFPYITDFLASQCGNLPCPEGKVETTFDADMTESIKNLADHVLDTIFWRNVSDYGILIAERGDPPKLRVMIGGHSYSDAVAGQVNTTLAFRQPGSTIKPFTYALAFETLGLTPEDTILDLPTGFKTQEGYTYEPKNYSQEYLGEISLRRALSESVNIPAVKLLEEIRVETLLAFLRSLGITSLTEKADHYGLALTLGVGEVSLFELLRAYTIFSNAGDFCPLVFFPDDKNLCVPRIDAKYTNMIVSILSDRYAKIGGFPIDSVMDFSDRFVFVKTGTSRNFRDNWAIGFTEHYLIAVWVGNKSGENMKGVSGATGAGSIFREIVYFLEPDEYENTPVFHTSDSRPYVAITNPVDGSVYQISDDSPTIHPIFSSNLEYDSVRWFLDDVPFAGENIPLELGRHTMTLELFRDGVVVGTGASDYTGVREE